MAVKSLTKIIQGIFPEFLPGPTARSRIDGYVFKTTDPDELLRLISRDLRQFGIYKNYQLSDVKKELERELGK